VATAAELARHVAQGEVSAADTRDVFVPLGELIGDRVRAGGPPYLVSIVGSVAVGKSTTARALRAVLAAVPPGRRVEIVSTDGFLFPNRELLARGLFERKGFPETFDVASLRRFVDAVRARTPNVSAPVYSHIIYDVVDDEQVVHQPDVLILEGMPLANDRVDLSVYLDAREDDIEAWFVERFVGLCREAEHDDASFFRTFAGYSEAESIAFARQVWATINAVNLHECILPVRELCDVVLEKGPDHTVRRVRLRRAHA
jgi:type I pantothenate kinase